MKEEELKQMNKEELLGVIKAQKYEIKNKDKVINGMIENEEKYNLEIIKLKSIIKEVREYIESYNLPKDLGHLGEAPISIRELRDILEILEKENK